MSEKKYKVDITFQEYARWLNHGRDKNQRLGQQFWNDFVDLPQDADFDDPVGWPELFYEKNEAKAQALIYKHVEFKSPEVKNA